MKTTCSMTGIAQCHVLGSRGSLDANGSPTAWMVRVVAPSFTGMRNGVDNSAVGGVANIPYEIPNIYADYHAPYVTPDVLNDFRPVGFGIPVDYWRAPGANANAYYTESFIDELAAAAGKIRSNSANRCCRKIRGSLATMQLAAEKAGWGKPLPAGHFQGVATGGGSGSLSTQIAEISIEKGKVKVHRIVTAVDCGQIINPRGAVQQVESGIIYGLAQVLRGAITIDKGRVMQTNFHQYEPLRMDEVPKIEVYLMPNTNNPTGLGEHSNPHLVPAHHERGLQSDRQASSRTAVEIVGLA